jgi:hypothetical protein
VDLITTKIPSTPLHLSLWLVAEYTWYNAHSDVHPPHHHTTSWLQETNKKSDYVFQHPAAIVQLNVHYLSSANIATLFHSSLNFSLTLYTLTLYVSAPKGHLQVSWYVTNNLLNINSWKVGHDCERQAVETKHPEQTYIYENGLHPVWGEIIYSKTTWV